jgi:hypothetical protein
MRLGRDDAPDGVKSVLSGLPRPLAAVMPRHFAVLLRAWPRKRTWGRDAVAKEVPGEQWRMKGHAVIFVGGCMRSGTTLLQRMLCASQDARPFTDECQFLTALIDFLVAWRQRFDWLKDFYGTPEGYEAYAKATVDAFLRASFETQRPARTIVPRS